MDKKIPLFSIITVVYNGEKYLEETIQSILAQSYENIEYIIIDGGSTDGTLELIQKYEDKIATWISEADNGIYDAMNKGLARCTGEIVGIVNADDILYPDTLKKVCSVMEKEGLDYVYGSVDMMSEEGELMGAMLPMKAEEINKRKYDDIPFPHPSLFVRKSLYETIGGFDTRFSLSADYEFILRLLEGDFKGAELKKPTGKFRSGGSSGGVATFIDTKNVLLAHNAPRIRVYKNMFSSLAKLFLMRYFPSLSDRVRLLFRKNSRHQTYIK